jgi:hypothetical protein
MTLSCSLIFSALSFAKQPGRNQKHRGRQKQKLNAEVEEQEKRAQRNPRNKPPRIDHMLPLVCRVLRKYYEDRSEFVWKNVPPRTHASPV